MAVSASRWRVGAALGLVLVATGLATSVAAETPDGPGGTPPEEPVASASVDRPFADDSFWNEPLAPDAPLDAGSAGFVADLRRQVKWGSTVNTSAYSVPVVTVPVDQPTVRVALTANGAGAPALQAAFEAVPLPDDARPAAGDDAHLVVWQPSTDKMWEFFKMARGVDGWSASWGGFSDGVSSSPGYFGDPSSTPWWQEPEKYWGARASGLPLLGGLVRVDELKEGRVDHAIAISVTEARHGYYSAPARRTDGQVTSTQAPIEGMRFRLPPDLDLDALDLPRATRILARAAQEYGIVVVDRATNGVAMYAEDVSASGSTPYPELFGGPNHQVLSRFPWASLLALRTDVDRTPPLTTITSGPGPVTSAETVRFAFDSDDPNVKMQCGMDTVRYSSCGYERSFSGLGEGPHRAWAQAVDSAGLYRPQVYYEFTVDRTVPAVTIGSGPATLTTSPAADFVVQVSEDALLECSLDGGAPVACGATPSYVGLPDGSHTLSVRAADRAGNTSVPATWAWTVDSRPPAAARITLVHRQAAYSQSTFYFSAADGTTTFDCRLDQKAWARCGPRYVYYTLVPAGAHAFAVRARDEAGNVGVAATYSWTQ